MQVRFEDIPPEWGFQKGDLPPLGASPDAVLRYSNRTELMHNAPLLDDRAAVPVRRSATPQPGRQQGTVQHEQSTVQWAQQPSAQVFADSVATSTTSWVTDAFGRMHGDLAAAAADSVTLQGQDQQAGGNPAPQGGQAPSVTGRQPSADEATAQNGSAAPPAAILEATPAASVGLDAYAGPGATTESGSAEPPTVLDCLEHIEELLQKLQFQQTVTLSALGTLTGSQSTAAAGKNMPAGSPDRGQSDPAKPQPQLHSRRAHSGHSATAELSCRAQEAREQLDAQEGQRGPAGPVEMVEIKNSSPFGELTSGRLTKKGKAKGFCLNDPGPRIAVRTSSITSVLDRC